MKPPHRSSDSGLPAESSDEELAGRAADGEVRAFEELVERFGGQVVAALEKLVGDHHLALDAAQDVWIKVHRSLPRYRKGARFRPWLFAIALNHGRDVLRMRARRPDTAAGSEAFDDARPDPTLLAPRSLDPGARVLDRGAIAAVLQRIDATFREALVLVDVLGVGYEEAALSLDTAVGTVKSRVHRARLAFRDAWLAHENGTAAPARRATLDPSIPPPPPATARRPRPLRSQS
ncbi:MAG: RNA polymerase sigma factor [Planctomycetota bacterium]